jgi:hypothetical protein
MRGVVIPDRGAATRGRPASTVEDLYTELAYRVAHERRVGRTDKSVITYRTGTRARRCEDFALASVSSGCRYHAACLAPN